MDLLKDVIEQVVTFLKDNGSESLPFIHFGIRLVDIAKKVAKGKDKQISFDKKRSKASKKKRKRTLDKKKSKVHSNKENYNS